MCIHAYIYTQVIYLRDYMTETDQPKPGLLEFDLPLLSCGVPAGVFVACTRDKNFFVESFVSLSVLRS